MATVKSVKSNPMMQKQGIYLISNEKLAYKSVFKVGYSDASLNFRLNQIRSYLAPSFNQELLVYAVIVPKYNGSRKGLIESELREIEGGIFWLYEDFRRVFTDTKKPSEWIEDVNPLEMIEDMKFVLEKQNYTRKYKVVNLMPPDIIRLWK